MILLKEMTEENRYLAISPGEINARSYPSLIRVLRQSELQDICGHADSNIQMKD